MSDMKARWKALDGRFASLARREKMLIASSGVVGALMIGSSLFVEPQINAAKVAKRAVDQSNNDMALLSSQLVSLNDQLKSDPDAARKAELAALRAKIVEMTQKIAAQQSALVPPERMNKVLETILQRHPTLRMVSLKTLKPSSVLSAQSESADGKTSGRREFDLFRHGVEVRISGTYSDLYEYLRGLEQQPQKLIWTEVELATEEYPRAVLTIVLHTLSSERAWLEI